MLAFISSSIATLLALLLCLLVFPRFVGFAARRFFGWIGLLLRRKTNGRRELLRSRIRAEEESYESRQEGQTEIEDEDWEKVEGYGSGQPGFEGHREDDWDGVVGFFHPFCNAGGGGERVLWAAVLATQKRWPRAICAVYTGDHDVDKTKMLENIETRFNIRLHPPTVVFLYLSTREYVLSSTYPRFTLLGQSLGSLVLAYDAFRLLVPDIFIDTMGYSFTLCLSHFLFPSVPTGAYVHYPTISTDMLESLYDLSGLKGVNAGAGMTPWRGRAKRHYWNLFAKLYGWVGGSVDVVMCNSSWTADHIRALWLRAREKRKRRFHEPNVIFPPVAVAELERTIKIDLPTERESRRPTILYIAQFRPEKNHALILRAFAELLKRHHETSSPSAAHSSPQLVLIGSVRQSSPDETHIYNLRLLAHELRIRDHTTFLCDASWPIVLEHLRHASIGTNAMWNEHFGIGVVEYQAAGLISVVHDSGGPKRDIVVNAVQDNNAPNDDDGLSPGNSAAATGFRATTESEFATAFAAALEMPAAEKVAMRTRARNSARRFSDDAFARNWVGEMEKLVGLQVERCGGKEKPTTE